VTADRDLAARLRALRNYGCTTRRGVSDELGFNSRLDAIQAGVLRALLPHLDDHNRERAGIAAAYRAAFADHDVELTVDDPGAVYHQFAIAVAGRDTLRDFLHDAGIVTGIHYDPPVHLQPLFASCPRGPLAETERLSQRMISLPVQPEVVRDRAGFIADAVVRGLAACRAS
jgi:dTDP-4-amino-4,6-dideoxygalactose transaminase